MLNQIHSYFQYRIISKNNIILLIIILKSYTNLGILYLDQIPYSISIENKRQLLPM